MRIIFKIIFFIVVFISAIQICKHFEKNHISYGNEEFNLWD